ncbi:bZIP transcription factor [Aspergillus clavatus NRRL 1]|uniref:BZIP transcription factor (MeaB), putative n=1 Tax=Aspergillus clavatus (strain ATCC 1007 / CBS 513.65 / DSM 816 / NCTC 3887 / NRRL 1 / QM 1276 / 107) TaxID=344612 RepID=A1CKJ4_ASPCL|nr:bZIP transcription factor (MeaB), putative [Aspergillus clavatus NRRL 1]EAW09668.1 bZIP transcription factor (MeaB), putative [Aspergillus clavatus NRRL 1]
MVSMVEASNSNHNDTAPESVVPKAEPLPEGSISSSVSTPEAEGEVPMQDVAQTQKRKGGRKPIYATSEERKQRNRQAQAAFRERRTEYIRQLETTIKRNEETLQTLQQNHRTAADECLMLRYKNSLLERILLEKGIDVQAELRLKAGAPGGNPIKPSPMVAKPPSTLERVAVNRSTAHRLPAGIAPKGDAFAMSRDGAYGMPSPQFQATPSSHVSSPSHTKSPGFAFQGAMSPTGMDPAQAQHARSQLNPHSRSLSQASPPLGIVRPDSVDPKSATPGGTGPRGTRMPSAAYYPSPFQKHYDQLDQEYDAQADMIDEEHDSGDAPPYVSGFNAAAASVASGAHPLGPRGLANFNSHGEASNGAYGNTNQLLGNYEPMLDADPFGLSASMHFQTPFSYEQTHTRH